MIGRRFGVSLVSRVSEDHYEQVADRPGRSPRHRLRVPQRARPGAHLQLQARPDAGRRLRRAFSSGGGACTTQPSARAWRSSTRVAPDEVVELLAYHFGASAEAEKAVDYALLRRREVPAAMGECRGARLLRERAQRLETMPDTPENRLRRIDAVVKQAEVKFALGRHAEHVEALEGIKDLVDACADPPRRATWYYWTGIPPQPHRCADPRSPITYCREAARDR